MASQYIQWINGWYAKLPEKSFQGKDVVPEKTAVVSVDMIKGFCSIGPLASENVAAIIPNVVALFKKAHELGVLHYLLVQDAHTEDAVEFAAYPPHCLEGTQEAETIDELRSLPFANQCIVYPSYSGPDVRRGRIRWVDTEINRSFFSIEKNSLSPAYNTVFDEWLKRHQSVDTFIVVGNCTDLCVYSMAMHLRLSANAANLTRRIIVPADCVATYDLSVENAEKIGAAPHEAAIIHPLFLHHMHLNGVDVVKRLS